MREDSEVMLFTNPSVWQFETTNHLSIFAGIVASIRCQCIENKCILSYA